MNGNTPFQSFTLIHGLLTPLSCNNAGKNILILRWYGKLYILIYCIFPYYARI